VKEKKKEAAEKEPEVTEAVEPVDKEAESQAEPETEPDQEQLTLLKDQLLRQMAEYDNYRKRTAKEKLEQEPEIKAKVISAILPVMDSVERALKAECSDENYKKGVEMIYASFTDALKNLGVEEITAEDFDPQLHQAVQHVEKEGMESGKVAEVFQKGYKIGGKVIRFAMVSIVK